MIKELNKLTGKIIRYYINNSSAEFGYLLEVDEIGLAVLSVEDDLPQKDRTGLKSFFNWKDISQVDYFPEDQED